MFASTQRPEWLPSHAVPSPGDTVRKVLLCGGPVSSLLYVVATDSLAAARWDDYSRTGQMVSDLFAVGSPGREVLVRVMWVYTVLFVAFGVGVWNSARRNRALRVGASLLVTYGLWNIPAGFFPLNLHDDSATPMHIVVTNIQLALMVASMGFVAVAFHGRLRVYTVASLVTSVVLGIASFIAAPGPNLVLGVGERISIGAFLLWVAVLAAALWRAPMSAGDPTTNPRVRRSIGIRAYDRIYERCAGHPRHRDRVTGSEQKPGSQW